MVVPVPPYFCAVDLISPHHGGPSVRGGGECAMTPLEKRRHCAEIRTFAFTKNAAFQQPKNEKHQRVVAHIRHTPVGSMRFRVTVS